MARIPVEKKNGGTPWWAWLLGLLLLAAVIWLLVSLFDGNDEDQALAPADTTAAYNDYDTTEAMGATGGTITSVSTLANGNATDLAGRQFRLSDMRVESVQGDQLFWVTPADAGAGQGTGERYLVSLREQLTPDQPGTEGRYDITEGQILTIHGSVREINETDASAWGLDDEGLQDLEDRDIYLNATSVDVQEEAGA